MESLRTHYSIDVTSKEYGKNISVAGWVEDIRNIGSIAFIILRDKKGTLQITAIKKTSSYKMADHQLLWSAISKNMLALKLISQAKSDGRFF